MDACVALQPHHRHDNSPLSAASRRRLTAFVMDVRNPSSVLLLTPTWSRDGGVGAHVIASASALAQRGVRVAVVAQTVASSPDIPGVTVHCREDLLDRSVSPDERLGDVLSGGPSVVHLHQIDDPDLVHSIRRVAPVVASVHGYNACMSGVYYFEPGHECERGHGPGCVVNLLARGCAHRRDLRPLLTAYRRKHREVSSLKAADMVIAYSSSVDRHLANNGVSSRAVVPLFATLPDREAAAPYPDDRRVLFAGRITAVKGVDTLLRATTEVDTELVICGDGWRLAAMRAYAEELGISARVSFTGWLDADALSGELAAAAVVAVPSLWPEPFGLIGIEALAAGRPVVASATGGIGDWLADGTVGLRVPPGDSRALARALNKMLDDPTRLEAMGQAGRRLVAAKFSPKAHLTALLGAYERAALAWNSSAA